MTDFDLNIFLSMPRDIHVTNAAAKLIDVIAIKENIPTHLLTAGLFAYHLTSVADEIEARRAELAGMNGGSFARDYPDGLSTMDIHLPGYNRVSLICTTAECESAQMDIEDFINHMGAKITHIS